MGWTYVHGFHSFMHHLLHLLSRLYLCRFPVLIVSSPWKTKLHVRVRVARPMFNRHPSSPSSAS